MLLNVLLLQYVWLEQSLAVYSDEKRLFQDVIDPIDKRVRPTYNDSRPVLVHIGFTPYYFKGLDEPSQIMEMFAWLSVVWQNPQIRWIPDDYGGVSRITLDADELWSPDIGIINSADHLYGIILDTSKYRMVLHHDGTAKIFYCGAVQTYCVVDVTLFPFDQQVCHVEFDIWSLPMEFVKLNETSFVRMTNYRKNGIWNVDATWTVITRQYYQGFTQAPVSFVFRLSRRPLYVLTNIAFPMILLFLLEMLVFWIPPEAGEKISLAITLMLSLTVFQLVIRESMPATSDYFPYMSYYLLFVMSLSALTLVQTVVVVRIHHRDPNRPVSPWVARVVRVVAARLLCLPKSTSQMQKAEIKRKSSSCKKDDQRNSIAEEDSVSVCTGDNTEGNIWILMARVIDRISAILFLLVALITTTGLFWGCATGGAYRKEPIGSYGYYTTYSNESQI